MKLDKGQRFGFHNLRHSLASFLVTKKKTDVKTAQRSTRHAKSTTMPDHYAQTDMDELIVAQEMMLDAIFSHEGEAVPVERLLGWIEEWIKIRDEQIGDGSNPLKKMVGTRRLELLTSTVFKVTLTSVSTTSANAMIPLRRFRYV